MIPKHEVFLVIRSVNLWNIPRAWNHLKSKHRVILLARLFRISMQNCKKGASSSRERPCAAKVASVRVITRNRFGISMSPGDVPTDRLFVPLTNVHYSHPCWLLRFFVLVRSRLTCSGAGEGKNAAARYGISCRRVEGVGRLEAFRGIEGPRRVTNCNHGQQSGEVRGQWMHRRKETVLESALLPIGN